MLLDHVEWDSTLRDYVEHWVAVLPTSSASLMSGAHHVAYTVEAWSTRSLQRWHATNVHEALVAGPREACLQGPVDANSTQTKEVDIIVCLCIHCHWQVPSWLAEAVIYMVLPDSFAPDPGKQFSDRTSILGMFVAHKGHYSYR